MEDSIAQFQEEQKTLLEERLCAANKQIQELHVSLNEEEEKLSLDMKHPPTKEQLRHKKTDPLSALLSFTTDTGPGRMSKMKDLHKELLKMKSVETDASEVPEEFTDLIEEIRAENSSSNLSRIISSYKKKSTNKLACLAVQLVV